MEQTAVTKEITRVDDRQVEVAGSLFFDKDKFEMAQRVAKLLAESNMVPAHYRNNIPNTVIALNMAERMQLDPFMVMQKTYIVRGKPGIEAQLVIALINATKRFTPLRYDLKGDGDEKQCRAHADSISTGERINGPSVSIGMAKKAGWYHKEGSAWQTMPDLMLRYRAASFFANVNCPEVKFGLVEYDSVETTPSAPKVYQQPAIQRTPDANNQIEYQIEVGEPSPSTQEVTDDDIPFPPAAKEKESETITETDSPFGDKKEVLS